MNSNFEENQAKYFGGAIYIEFEELININIVNTTFTSNRAYIGGAIYDTNGYYSSYDMIKNNITFTENHSDSHGTDYATKPYYINLTSEIVNNEFLINSGDLRPLEFEINDKFNNTVMDSSKIYSNIVLNVKIDETENNSNITNNIKLVKNSCNFSNGKCELTDFKIFSKTPSTFSLKLSLENENMDVQFNIDTLNFTIRECNENQIVMYTNDEYYYCENPICNSNCPYLDSNATAECIKDSDKNINDIKLNKCKCMVGWIGENCNQKEFINLNHNYIYIATTPMIIVIILTMIYFTINRNKKIIDDPGYIKCMFILIGLFLVFISFNFNRFKDYRNCSLEFVFKHCGVMLIYEIYSLFIMSSSRLGIDFDEINRLTLSIFQSTTNNLRENNEDENKENILLKKKINNGILYIHTLYVEFTCLYIGICIIFLVTVIIYSKSETDYTQEFDGKWRYKCSLSEFDLVMNLIEFLIFLYLLSSSIKIWNYNYIFKCIKYIGFSIPIGITFGPLMN
eukprot:jgi/Orpsp1_1/1190458/evm.model.d7180000079107.1